MKVQVLSDAHLEFHQDEGKEFVQKLPVVGDVLVVAGDFALTKMLCIRLIELCRRFKQVVYVVGNHEYYLTRGRDEVHKVLEKVSRRCDNFHWLKDSTTTIDGQRFVGTPMWFPDDPLNACYEHRLNDFKLIPGYRKWVYEANEKARRFLQDTVTPDDVVVTHHAPSYFCVPLRWKGSDINRFFVCSWAERVIRVNEPKLWIFGHVHSPNDMVLNETRVVSNPFGYAGTDEVVGFQGDFVVQVG